MSQNHRMKDPYFRLIVLILGGWFITGLFFEPLPALANPSLPIVAEDGDFSIEVHPIEHKLVLRIKGRVFKTYSVAVGNPSTPTPVGEYKIIYKGTDWGPAFGPRWLGLNVPWGFYGIHGTNRPSSIGHHRSHGCIRMNNRDVLELYDLVPVGTKVTIYGHLLGYPNQDPRTLAEGDIGGDVQLVQTRLKSAGYYLGVCNGKFRGDTSAALRKFQREYHLPVDGIVTKRVYIALGLLE